MDFTVQCEQRSAETSVAFVFCRKTLRPVHDSPRDWDSFATLRSPASSAPNVTHAHIICICNTFSVICLCIENVYMHDKRVVSVTAPAIRAIVGAVNSSVLVTALTNYAASVSDLGRNKISNPTILCQCPMICSSDIDDNAAWRQHKGFSILILLTTDTL